MTRIIAALSLFLSLTSAALANTHEIGVSVDAGRFLGDWRFAESREGPNIGAYTCAQPPVRETKNGREIKWYRGDCEVVFTPGSLGLTGEVSFEIRAAHSIIAVNISGSGLRLQNPVPANPTISVSSQNSVNLLTIHTAEIRVNTNGYKGRCGFEYLYTQDGKDSESCGGLPVYLPLGTAWNLVIGGHQLHPVFVGHDGTPFPFGLHGRPSPLSLQRPRTVSMTTIDVRLTPMVSTIWSLARASDIRWKDYKTQGAQTVRLPRYSQFRVGVFPAVGAATGANFVLPVGCDDSAQTLYIPDYSGVFMIQQHCATVQR